MKYQPQRLPAVPPTGPALITEDHRVLRDPVTAALESVWSISGGSWSYFMNQVKKDAGPSAEETTQWMRAAVAAASALTETRYVRLLHCNTGVVTHRTLYTLHSTLYTASI